MSVDLSKLAFYSGANYMKRSDLCGSYTIDLSYDGVNSYSGGSLTINHGLGYVPFVDVYPENTTDTIWAGDRVSTYTDRILLSGNTTDDGQIITKDVDDENVTISFKDWTTTSRTSVVVHVLIYLDYGS